MMAVVANGKVSGRIVVDYHHYQCMGDEAGDVAEHLEAEGVRGLEGQWGEGGASNQNKSAQHPFVKD